MPFSNEAMSASISCSSLSRFNFRAAAWTMPICSPIASLILAVLTRVMFFPPLCPCCTLFDDAAQGSLDSLESIEVLLQTVHVLLDVGYGSAEFGHIADGASASGSLFHHVAADLSQLGIGIALSDGTAQVPDSEDEK